MGSFCSSALFDFTIFRIGEYFFQPFFKQLVRMGRFDPIWAGTINTRKHCSSNKVLFLVFLDFNNHPLGNNWKTFLPIKNLNSY